MNGAPSDSHLMLSHPCWYCHWWGGTSGSAHSLCERLGGPVKQAQPRTGCAYYERETGVDNDAWEPIWQPLPALKPPTQPRAGPRHSALPVALILDAPGATPEQRARGLAAAGEAFALSNVDAREAWACFTAGVRGDAYSSWVLAEMAAVNSAGAPGRLSLADDD